MNQPNMFEDSFENSLRSLAPNLPADTKSRLLYECGVAAAETKSQNRRWKFGAISSMALLAATGLGFVLGNSFSNPNLPNPQMAATSNPSSTKQDQTQLTYSAVAPAENPATLAVAMAPSQVFELLDRVDNSEQSILSEVPTSMKIPFGTRSLATEL